jgi:endo-1,4-beta-xylanase
MNEYPQAQLETAQDAMLSRRNFLLLAGVGTVGVMTAGCSDAAPQEVYPPQPDCGDSGIGFAVQELSAETTSLVAEYEWDTPGVEKRGDSLWLTPISTAVFNKDTKTYQPIQRFNTQYRIDGDAPLDIAAQYTSRGGSFSLALAEMLPLIHDDFVVHGKGTTLTFQGDTLQIEVYDGKLQQPAVSTVRLAPASGPRNVVVRRSADAPSLLIDGQAVDLASLPSKNLWLGVSAQDGPVEVGQLALSAQTGQTEVVEIDTLQIPGCGDGLQQALDRRDDRSAMRFGVAVSRTPLLCDERYASLVVGNFGGTSERKGSLTPENALKPQFTQPEEGVFTLQEAKQLVRFADRYGMEVHGHALIPNRSFPKWMAELPTDTPEQKRRVRDVMVNHIKTLVSSLPEITSWDLFNEPLGWEGWNQTPFFKAMGEDMFEIGLRAALEANPKGKFWINDFAMDKAGGGDEARFATYFDLMERLAQKGLRFAGLGMQGHVYQLIRDTMSPDHIQSRARRLRDEGFELRISEMDVVTYFGEHGPTTDEGLLAQAAQFHDIGQMCVREGIDITTWGVGSKYVSTAWLQKGELHFGTNTLWDEHLRQRPAYAALLQALR